MDIDLISTYWDTVFQGVLPVSSTLRGIFPDRWVRFHTLPESKRYSETSQDYVTILDRYNSILNELVDEDGILLFTTCYSKTKNHRRRNHSIKKRGITFEDVDPGAKFWRTLHMHEIDHDFENPNYWHVYTNEYKWKIGVFDEIFKLIADDVISNVFFASLHHSWVYCPYDGGCDVILSTEMERDELKNKYKQWLSKSPSGL